MKILFVWSGLTGYMGDCWRELAKAPGVELKLSVDTSGSLCGGRFEADNVMRGLDWSENLPTDWTPDVVFTVGWRNALCRAAALREWGKRTRKVCCFDMPWEWRLRKIAARFVLWRYLRRFDAAFVPGTLARRYARWLGFKTDRIFKGLFSTDTRRFGAHVGGRGFLYVGRESAEKGLDVLRAAHERYRSEGGTWPLEIVNGVSPDALGPIYAGADCFVLASLYEPWGVVLVEAAAAGLPIICTDACGARHEVVRGNGIVVKAGSVRAMAEAMVRMWNGERGVGARIGKTVFVRSVGGEGFGHLQETDGWRMIRRIWTLLKHWREAKSALSTLSYLYDGKSRALDALGGLTEEEMRAVCAWATEDLGMTVVEVGTLFGLTARELAWQVVGGRVIAVDNFSWNPFGLPPKVHEAFTRQILRGSKVELINCSSEDWREKVTGRIDMVFFDASHRYEDVKAECEWAKAAGIKMVCGHDYGNPNPLFGVTRAVDEVFGKENVEVVGMCWRVKL